MPSIAEALRAGAARLAAAGLDPDGAAPPRREAELLLCAAAGLSHSTLIAWPDRALTAEQAACFEGWVARRAAGEPLAYILGRCGFYGLQLAITPATLIPRPETELLVDWLLAVLPADASTVCADLGTGSGAIAAALAHERPNWTLVAIERSAAAIDVATANARALALVNLLPVRGDWLAAIADASLDAVISNPPYVRADDPHLYRGDLRFEPASALAAGAEGLDAIRIIIDQARRRLRPGGHIAIEHGWDQGAAVSGLLAAAGYERVATHSDLAGHDRFTSARHETAAAAREPEHGA